MLAAADGSGNGATAAAPAAAGEAKALRGPGGDARPGDGREPRGPDRDLVPDDLGRHPGRQAEGPERDPQRARDEGLLHPPDRLGDRPGGPGVAGDDAGLRAARRQTVRDRGRPGQPRDRGRHRAQGRVPQPDGADDQGLRRPRLRRLPHLLRGTDQEDAREQADRRRLPGDEHLADQPGRDRDDRLGAAAAERAERDHRHRLDRLPARVGPRRPGPDQAARRLEGDDDDLDLRPPGHPGGRVGLLPAPDRAAPAGRGRLLRVGRGRPRGRVERDHRRPPGRRLGAAARRAAAGDHPDPARRGAAAGRPGRDLAAQGLPDPRPPRRPARPARQRAEGRPGDPAREPQPDPGADGADPGLDPADRRPRRDPARGAAADARGLLRHDRLPVRAPLLPPAADLAAGDGRDRRPPRAARRRRETAPAAAPDRRLRVRALHREGLPRAEDLHDRGPRRDRADARRADHPLRPRRRRGGRLRDGPPRPARVLAHNLGRSVESILAEFEGSKQIEAVKAVAAIPHHGTGDVKYHYGHEGVYETHAGEKIAVRLYPNPSHLEFVEPGRGRRLRASSSPTSRARSSTHDPRRAVPVLLHGDAAFPGQGVVAETLNLQGLRGYTTGGTIHIIQNNQVGFTTDPEEAPVDPLRGRHGEGIQRPDRPRQRRRRRGLLGRDPARDGLPRALGPGHRHRRHRVPPLRPQRDRRAGLHPADDRGQDQGPPAGVGDLRGEADRRGRDRQGRRRARGDRTARGDVGGAERPATEDGARRVRRPHRDDQRDRGTRPQRQPAGRDRGRRSSACAR